jgi:hypothetical protein
VSLRLLRRAGCHLCDEIAERLDALGVEYTATDIDTDPALVTAYGDAIPVLLLGDGEIARAPIDTAALRGALERAGIRGRARS